MFRLICFCAIGFFFALPGESVHVSGHHLLSLDALWGASARAETRVSARASYKLYRTHRNDIMARFRVAARKRYSEPCRAQRRFQSYSSWLSQFGGAVPGLALRKHHKRYLRGRVRSYTRLTKRRISWSKRRCERYWRDELKRSKSTLRSKCSEMQATDPKAAAQLWVGVRPWAHLYLNGKLCGTAPIRANLRPGSYKIRLSYPPGRDEFRVELQLAVSKKPVYLIHPIKSTPKAPRKDEGMLSQDQLNFSIKRYQSQMQACKIYQGDAGRVLLSWKISAEGKPHTILWVSPINPNPRFQKCILRAASRMRFPKIKGIARIDAHPILLD